MKSPMKVYVSILLVLSALLAGCDEPSPARGSSAPPAVDAVAAAVPDPWSSPTRAAVTPAAPDPWSSPTHAAASAGEGSSTPAETWIVRTRTGATVELRLARDGVLTVDGDGTVSVARATNLAP